MWLDNVPDCATLREAKQAVRRAFELQTRPGYAMGRKAS